MLKPFSSQNKDLYIILMTFLLFLSFCNVTTLANEKGRPDLIIFDIDLPGDPPGNITEGDEAEFIVRIKNIKNQETGEYGNVSVGVEIVVALLIDDSLVSTNSTSDGLNVDETKYVNLSWIAESGSQKRDISIEIDYPSPGNVIESDENNNFWDGYIYVSEKSPELEIINVDIPQNIIVNQTVTIESTIKNNGRATNNPIYAKLNSSVDGEIQTLVKNDSLSRHETHNFSFKWTPSYFGSQTISIDLVYEEKTHDFEEVSVVVEVEYLQWWDENWHYRYFLSVNGNGDVSVFFNFTKLLNDLGVFSQTFENETVRIVQYTSDGNFTSEISNYIFNESTGFDNITNATGALIWNITGPSFEKFYCIYFDVLINLGTRKILDETNIKESGNASIGDFGFVDGWGIKSVHPINGSYAPTGELVNITVTTNAKAENVTAYIFMKDNLSENFYVYLFNAENYTFWISDDFSFNKEGNWTIFISTRDWANYSAPDVKQAFFVGKPDVEIKNISFSTIWTSISPKIYINDTVNITAGLVSYDANVEDVNVSLSIFDISKNEIIYKQYTKTTIYMDRANYVSFSWNANRSGKFNVTVTLDPENLIEEKNEDNNELFKKITVYEIPDLKIVDIILPTFEITELDRVKIDTVVANVGLGDAIGYEIKLYIEPVEQGGMKWLNDVYSKLVDIDSNSSQTVSLYWDSAKSGTWLVGVKALVNDTNRDTNISNNRLDCDETLKVKPIERNPPVILEVIVKPSYQEQGRSITITAMITDDTGLESVYVKITNPSGLSYNNSMSRTIGDEFRHTFTDTIEVGIYSFRIIAVDLTIHRNTATRQGNFSINKESTPPIISYFDAQPRVQLKGKSVNITCIATDNIEIKSVIVTITTPSIEIYNRNMEYTTQDKYAYISTYDTSGKYVFQIEARDKANNVVNTPDKTFWITSDLEDKDDDGIPDWWEEKYGLDPENPNDADYDPDGDGYSNLEEYKMGTNPKKDIFSENAGYRIKENSLYLAGSIVLFLIIILLSIFSKQRKLI